MKRTFSSKIIAAAALAGAVLGLAPAAQARTDVQLSIGLPGLPIFVPARPAPVYYEQVPVYVQPRPVYGPPPVLYERPWRPAYRHDYHYGYEREHAWRHFEWQRREWERRHQDWERAQPHDRHGRN